MGSNTELITGNFFRIKVVPVKTVTLFIYHYYYFLNDSISTAMSVTRQCNTNFTDEFFFFFAVADLNSCFLRAID